MSEMLGNHYFQLRDFSLAERTYECLSQNQLTDLRIIKKLIICYTQTYHLDKALELLLLLIKKDINTLHNSNLKEDDCPCNELIFQIENGKIKYASEYETYISLGILWLYCKHTTSLKYFQMALNKNSKNQNLIKVITFLKNLSKQNILQTN